jgi:hypothetical protein
MNKCSVTVALLWVCSLLAPSAYGQFPDQTSPEKVLVGLTGGMAFSWHQGNYTTSDAQFDCCTFAGGSGIGRVAGLRSVVPLSRSLFLRPGISFDQLNADYPAEREAYPVFGREDQVVLMTLSEQLSITLDAFSVELLLAWRVVDPGMYIMIGPSWSLLMSQHQTQEERILTPDDIAFLDGSRSHYLIDSEITGLSPFFSIRAGAGALFPISEMFHANPEVLFMVPLTDVQDKGEWSVSGFVVTLGVLLVL